VSASVKRFGLFIDAREVAADDCESIPVMNPANGQTWASIPDSGPDQIDRAVTAATKAYHNHWRSTAPSERARLLRALADVIDDRAEELARTEVRDNGKLLREMRAQLRALPGWYRYFAGLADKIHGETIPMDDASLFNFTLREPLGVIACLTPWNSPLLLGTWKFAPALAAGNTIVVKPSEHASVSTLEFAECFAAAGFPPGVFNVVTGMGKTAGMALISHPDVARVCFTGSGAAGSQVAAAATSRFVPVTLELGGKSPNILFGDAPVDAAVSGLLAGIFAAGGQTCVAGSRALIHRSIYEAVLDRLVERVERISLGDPMEAATEMGPIANPPQLAKVESYVAVGTADGARLVAGGHRPETKSLKAGLYFEPTVFADANNQMRIAREEIFGPVLAVIPFEDESEAVEIANNTPYGLAAGIWTVDVGRAHRVARMLDAGTVWINTYRAVAPNMPFGGFKDSGIGTENGSQAVNDFTRLKSVWLETEPSVGDPFAIKV
jgi:(Z)-2-((N-methylformamido)methylene)-5-hydroxybutyrolactone dehydrogenase